MNARAKRPSITVDPITGLDSTDPNAVPKEKYLRSRLVDNHGNFIIEAGLILTSASDTSKLEPHSFCTYNAYRLRESKKRRRNSALEVSETISDIHRAKKRATLPVSQLTAQGLQSPTLIQQVINTPHFTIQSPHLPVLLNQTENVSMNTTQSRIHNLLASWQKTRSLLDQPIMPPIAANSSPVNRISYLQKHNEPIVNSEIEPTPSQRHIYLVDPLTGKQSNAPDAITYSTWYNRCLVDPLTGKRSDASDAIPRWQWYYLKARENTPESEPYLGTSMNMMTQLWKKIRPLLTNEHHIYAIILEKLDYHSNRLIHEWHRFPTEMPTEVYSKWARKIQTLSELWQKIYVLLTQQLGQEISEHLEEYYDVLTKLDKEMIAMMQLFPQNPQTAQIAYSTKPSEIEHTSSDVASAADISLQTESVLAETQPKVQDSPLIFDENNTCWPDEYTNFNLFTLFGGSDLRENTDFQQFNFLNGI